MMTGTAPPPRSAAPTTPEERAPAHGAHAVIPSLDGLRAVSVTIVLFGHAGVSRLIPGGFGVTVFFFLSGFLITTLFLREAARHGAISLKAFYLRRLLRLSPPLFTTLILVYALVAAGIHPGVIDPQAILSQALYVYNYYAIWAPAPTEGAQGFHILWSLSVEEHFYLVYPVLFLAWMKGRIRQGHVLALLGGFLFWRLLLWHVFAVPADHIYMRSDTRFDSILWGGLLALWQAEGRAGRLFADRPRARAGWMLGAAAVLALTFLWRDAAFRETWRYSLQGVALLPLFHYAVTRPDLALFRPLNWRPVARVGALSYSIYLIHYVLLTGLGAQGLRPASPLAAAILVGALSIAYAAALSRLVEDPVRGIRRRITGHRPAAAGAPDQGPPASIRTRT